MPGEYLPDLEALVMLGRAEAHTLGRKIGVQRVARLERVAIRVKRMADRINLSPHASIRGLARAHLEFRIHRAFARVGARAEKAIRKAEARACLRVKEYASGPSLN